MARLEPTILMQMPRPPRRAGLGLAEVAVVLAIIAFAVLAVLMALPRQRESARAVSCRRNLMQIGTALAQYDQIQGKLPGVAPLAPPESAGTGPLALMLGVLDVDGFDELSESPPEGKSSGQLPPPHRIRAFLCPSDPGVSLPIFTAPTSYRANAGSQTIGADGPFAPGSTVTLAEVEASDGTSYTAAFAERLLGTGHDGTDNASNYLLGPGPIGPDACPAPGQSSWKGNAGSSWANAGWVDTLYNHAMPPTGSPSCVAMDGQSARMGVSSGHVDGVQMLKLDGSVQTVTRSIDARVWRRFGGIHDGPEGAP